MNRRKTNEIIKELWGEQVPPEYYSCYRFYNSKKRRLSCFARPVGEEVELWIWECDRHDIFTKSYARYMYNAYLKGLSTYIVQESGTKQINPVILKIPLNGTHPKASFLDYLREKYYLAIPFYKQVGFKYLRAEQLENDENIIIWE